MTTHIVVDARLAGDSGIGTYIRNTVPRVVALEPEWRFTLIGDRHRLAGAAWARSANVLHCTAPTYSLREQAELVLRVPGDASVFWAPHFNVPLLLRTPLVVTVHDLAHLRLPQNVNSMARRIYAQAEFDAVRRKARSVLFDSEFSLREFRALVGEPRRSTVVPCGVDESWFVRDNGGAPTRTPYFVFVGNFKPHKNARALLEAMAANAGRLDATLVMIVRLQGLRTRDDSVWPLLESLGSRVQVIDGDGVDDAQLRRYVQHAAALVMPSLYEGFGLPPLEAMAAGTPALVASAGSLPEVCGEAAMYFDPREPSALADAMRRIIEDVDLRETLRQRGAAQARRYSWDATAALARRELAFALTNGAAS